MPTYEYKCRTGHITTRFSSIADYKSSIPCGYTVGELGCACIAERHITQAPMGFVQADLPAYRCPITDTPITSRKAHEENLAKHGCRVLESGEREEVSRRRAAEDAALEASVEKTAEEFVENLPSAKREQLGREIESGLDVNITRI